MKKLDDRTAWEQAWQAKMERAEKEPPQHLWAGIENRLVERESKRYRRRAFFFQWVAAAAVFLALGSLGLWWTYQQDGTGATTGLADARQETQDAAQEPNARTEGMNTSGLAAISPSERSADTGSKAEETNQGTLAGASAGIAAQVPAGSKRKSTVSRESQMPATGVYIAAAEESSEDLAIGESTNLLLSDNDLLALDSKAFQPFEFSLAEADFQKVWVSRKNVKEASKSVEDARFWLGTTLASNAFDPNYEKVTGTATSFALADKAGKGEASLAQTDSWDQGESSIPSINLSVQGGLQLSRRWSLQAGLQYGTYRISSQAGTFVDLENNKAYPLHYSTFNDSRIQRMQAGSRLAQPVDVENNFELLSIPLRLGYTLIDGRFNLTLTPGIASEIFLRNQLSSESEMISSYTVYSGSDSPYRDIYFSGVMGAQFSYFLGDNYLFTLEPSYRQAITDFNKSSSVFQSRPSSLGVGVGIRYIIR